MPFVLFVLTIVVVEVDRVLHPERLRDSGGPDHGGAERSSSAARRWFAITIGPVSIGKPAMSVSTDSVLRHAGSALISRRVCLPVACTDVW